MLDQAYPGIPKTWNTSITVTNTTLAKILCDETATALLAGPSGEQPYPGEAYVRSRVLTGGQRVIGGAVASTDAAAKSFLLYQARRMGTLGSGTHTITSQNLMTRLDGGSFITDGWRAGDLVMLFDSATAANNGALAVVTAVATGTLTVNGTPWTNDANVGAARVFRVTLRTRKSVPANSGNSDTIPAVPLLGSRIGETQMPELPVAPDAGVSLGPQDVLAVALVANASALPAAVSFTAEALLY